MAVEKGVTRLACIQVLFSSPPAPAAALTFVNHRRPRRPFASTASAALLAAALASAALAASGTSAALAASAVPAINTALTPLASALHAVLVPQGVCLQEV